VPNDPGTLDNLALGLKDLDRPDEAVETLRRALSIEAKNDKFHIHLGSLLIDQHKVEEAAKAAERALALDPNNHDTINLMGRVPFARGDLQEAVTPLWPRDQAQTRSRRCLQQYGQRATRKSSPIWRGKPARILAHCGLDWDPNCPQFHRTERPVRTASATQVRHAAIKNPRLLKEQGFSHLSAKIPQPVRARLLRRA
jgi:lipopolysaccharide biosynthesis regulator YciM